MAYFEGTSSTRPRYRSTSSGSTVQPGTPDIGGLGGTFTQGAQYAGSDPAKVAAQNEINAARNYDPGLNSSELAQILMSTTSGNTSGGSGGGGGYYGGGVGGGGGAAVTPEMSAAYQQLYASLAGRDPGGMYDEYGNTLRGASDAYRAAINAEYGRYDDAMRSAYDPGKVNAIYDTARGATQQASEAGLARLAGIMAELDSRAVQGRTDVNAAYDQGDSRLQDVMSRFNTQADQGTAQLNDVLGGFDAGAVANADRGAMQQLFAAGQIANARQGAAADAAMADRPAIYAGLNADVQSGMTRDLAGLQNQIAMRRAQGLMQNEQTLAGILGQSGLGRVGLTAGSAQALEQQLGQAGIQRIQAEQQAEQDRLKLAAELAAMGIQV